MITRLRRWASLGADVASARLDEWERQRYSRAPLCDAVLAPPEEYRRLWLEARAQSYPEVDAYERALGSAIDPEWFHQLALRTQVAIKRSAICYQHGRLLYAALSHYVRTRVPSHLTIVETGTARGFSALCMAKALYDSGASGRIVSFDVLAHDAPILWNNIRDVEGPMTRAELLREYTELIERHVMFVRGDTRREMARLVVPRVHFASLDSVHTYDHVMAEFAELRDRQTAGDVLFFDDYTPAKYPGVVKAVDEICLSYGYLPTVVTANAQRRYVIAEKQGNVEDPASRVSCAQEHR